MGPTRWTPSSTASPIEDHSVIDCVAGTPPDDSDAIDCVIWYGIVQGYANGNFGPADEVKRGQLATFVAGIMVEAGLTRPTTLPDAFATTTQTCTSPRSTGWPRSE